MNGRRLLELTLLFALLSFLVSPLVYMPLILNWIAAIAGAFGLACILAGRWDFAVVGLGIAAGIVLGVYLLDPHLWPFILAAR